MQAIASDIGLGHGLPSLHTLLICPRRLLQEAAGVLLADVRVFKPDREETYWANGSSSGISDRLSIMNWTRASMPGAIRPRQYALVVLRHNFRRLYVAALLPQQGHRGKFLMSALIKRTRMVAIEFGMWRSGRKGGSSGSITVG